MIVTTCVFLFAALIIMPIVYASELGCIEQFKSVESTVEVARLNENISPLELAALQHKIVESNAWLAKAQYWNSFPIISWYYPEKVMELHPIN
ncbi:MAG: hypothetical protein GWN64_05240 [Candidatus Thorarchaeota archaeon]|nr:hypothetical protein [Candidatus Thorarchaeota archaeon]